MQSHSSLVNTDEICKASDNICLEIVGSIQRLNATIDAVGNNIHALSSNSIVLGLERVFIVILEDLWVLQLVFHMHPMRKEEARE